MGTSQKLDIQDIKLVGSEGWGTDSIWVMNEDGTAVTGETYTWKNAELAETENACWWDDQNDCVATKIEISEGQGLYFYVDGENVSIQTAGSVKLGTFSRKMIAGGYTISGNFTPVEVDIQELKLVGSEGWGTDSIWVMNEDGTAVTGETYTWKNAELAETENDCWWDDQNDCVATGIKVAPGAGLNFYCDTEDISLEIKAVIPAK